MLSVTVASAGELAGTKGRLREPQVAGALDGRKMQARVANRNDHPTNVEQTPKYFTRATKAVFDTLTYNNSRDRFSRDE
jgi:hypothetical protein